MLRNGQITDTRDGTPRPFNEKDMGRSARERHLLAFLDRFDLCQFLYDSAYRRQLNEILDHFTDDEFARFERTHSRRFTVN